MDFVYSIAFLLLAFSIHEFCHAWVADRLGDPTPRMNGRVSLNPLRHIDPLGFLSLIILKIGWGKPVPVNTYNFSNRRMGELLVSLAGPLSNFVLALLAVLLARVSGVFMTLAILSFSLGIFNLFPIAPLDGFKVVGGLLPPRLALTWQSLERYGLFLIVLIILPILPGGNSVAFYIINHALDIFLKVFYA